MKTTKTPKVKTVSPWKRQKGCQGHSCTCGNGRYGTTIPKDVGDEPLTCHEHDLMRLAAIGQAALTFWPREKALYVIREAVSHQFETPICNQSYVQFIVQQIAEAMQADGAQIHFIDEHFFDVARGPKPKPRQYDPDCPF
ncbi:MAG: hypothetical protein ACP5I8_00710 [Phycisphaerae bacterium]